MACASSDKDGRDEDVTLMSNILKSYSDGSSEESDSVDVDVSRPSKYPSSSLLLIGDDPSDQSEV